ncbi:Nuclear speckle splicing regulatory protein 1 [Armadillidium nasatum]|uniref:Nuclear speckle splicing regulatory protein 1 n=1 Tax=Armadillidium nasatum TaxID=96803 RepID=A0A5N5STP0_9CRUS|nr:Nuclear speckle splicing regulatory protein 1 [Armadillidium nasatum]
MPGQGKEYGLILPNKKKEASKPTTRTLNPLATSDDELEKEEGESLNWVEASLKKSAGNSGQQSLQKRLLREALEEDATVFQYDEVYDDLKASQQEEKERKTQQLEKKPKYIETILKHTEKRKLENERRLERKVQKEREAEGNEFADKESFVTPSYLKKLEELKKAEETAEREKLIEEKLDVHKHKNFGVFYNHLLNQRVGVKEIKQEPEDGEPSGTSNESNAQKNSQSKQKNYRTQNDLSDEEPAQNNHLNIEIKKEVITSSSSEDETLSNREGKKGKEDKTIGSRERNNLFRRKSGSIDRSNIRHRSSSRDRVDHKYKMKESDDRRLRDKRDKDDRVERGRSRDRYRRQRSRSGDRRERSNDRKRERASSRERDRRDRSRDRDKRRSKDRSGLERSRDQRRKDISRSRSRDRTSDKREKDKRSKRSRSRDTHTKSDYKKEKLSENGSNEAGQKNNKENRNSKNGENKPVKQSINTTLGATDVNKMKIEDRIKRFTEIFAKRTTNKTYEDAVQRYFQRKAERGSSSLI